MITHGAATVQPAQPDPRKRDPRSDELPVSRDRRRAHGPVAGGRPPRPVEPRRPGGPGAGGRRGRPLQRDLDRHRPEHPRGAAGCGDHPRRAAVHRCHRGTRRAALRQLAGFGRAGAADRAPAEPRAGHGARLAAVPRPVLGGAAAARGRRHADRLRPRRASGPRPRGARARAQRAQCGERLQRRPFPRSSSSP